jgi:hypothetical protein
MKLNAIRSGCGSTYTRRNAVRMKLLRQACRVHTTRANRVKWLAAVAYLGDDWILRKPHQRAA